MKPARSMTVRLFDINNPSVNISVLTNDTGYYQITYPVSVYTPYNIKLRYEISGLNISFEDPSNNEFYYSEETFFVLPGYLQRHSYSFTTNSNDDNDINLNKAVSIHQACELIQRYYYQLNATYVDGIAIQLSHTYDYDVGYEARYHKDNYGGTLFLSYLDAFDWDIIEYEYVHYIEDNYGMYCNNYWKVPYNDLSLGYTSKEDAMKYAWQDGWAIFFVVNAQRYMNASNMGISGVGDTLFTNIGAYLNHEINFDIENFTDNLNSVPETVDKCETNILTIAALMYDFCDPVNTNDNDLMNYNNSTILYITINNISSKSLSDFMQKFNASSITTQDKLNAGLSLEWFDLSPKNITIPNLYQGSHTVYWTNPGNDYYNRITVYSSSLNVIWQSNMLFYQSSYTIDADTWADNFAGVGSVLFVVEGWQSMYPITGPYRSYQYLFIIT